MRSIIETYAQLLRDRSGINAILKEMDAQCEDAERTLESAKGEISAFAKAIKHHKSLLLLGMGASHYANELFSFQLRRLGINALTISASEFLYDPLPEWVVEELRGADGQCIDTESPQLEGEKLIGIEIGRAHV